MAVFTAACSRAPLGWSLCDSRLSLERPRSESELGPPQPLPLRWVIFSLLWDPRLIHFLCCLAFLSAVASFWALSECWVDGAQGPGDFALFCGRFFCDPWIGSSWGGLAA